LGVQDILEIISRQNHDFLNHLQVISGFLQLNKQEKAREYIKELGLEVERTARALNSRPPEVAAALLTVMNRARQSQVTMDLPAPLDLTGGTVSGRPLGSLLRSLSELALAWCPPSLTLLLQEQERHLTLRISCRPPQSGVQGGLGLLEKRVAAADAVMARYGGRARLLLEGDRVETVLTVPRREK